MATHHEVADNVVARPLAEKGHADDHPQPVSSSARVDELAEVPPRVVVAGGGALLEDLVVLQLDQGRVGVAFAVVLGEDGQRLLGAILVDQPWEKGERELATSDVPVQGG